MTTGTIKKLVGDRGFGFIGATPPLPGGKDLFFHRDDVGGAGFDSLREGQTVSYELGTDERRGSPKALRVIAA